jgi:hypothetical protein
MEEPLTGDAALVYGFPAGNKETRLIGIVFMIE